MFQTTNQIWCELRHWKLLKTGILLTVQTVQTWYAWNGRTSPRLRWITFCDSLTSPETNVDLIHSIIQQNGVCLWLNYEELNLTDTNWNKKNKFVSVRSCAPLNATELRTLPGGACRSLRQHGTSITSPQMHQCQFGEAMSHPAMTYQTWYIPSKNWILKAKSFRSCLWNGVELQKITLVNGNFRILKWRYCTI